MLTSADIMTDRQVADIIGVSLSVLQRRLRTGFKPGEIDLTRARPCLICGRRFWYRADVEKTIQSRATVPKGEGQTRGAAIFQN